MGSALQRGSERGRRATRFGVLECELGRVAAREGERESRGERRGRGPRPSRKFPRAARFRCPVHIITVLRIPTPEIVRALVALRALLSRFLPVFFTPPSLGLPAKLPHQRRIIVVHAGIRIIRAGSDDGCRRMRLAPRVESAREKR